TTSHEIGQRTSLGQTARARRRPWRNFINTWLQPGEFEPEYMRNCFNSFLLPAVTDALQNMPRDATYALIAAERRGIYIEIYSLCCINGYKRLPLFDEFMVRAIPEFSP